MALQLPEACISARVPLPGFIKPVLDHVIEVVFTTDRGDFSRDPVTDEILLHLELTEEDRELVPVLAREGAEEIWMVLDNPAAEVVEDTRATICVHGRIEYLCPLCYTMENF